MDDGQQTMDEASCLGTTVLWLPPNSHTKAGEKGREKVARWPGG